MKFRRYQHVERFGTTEVEDIQMGECLVFPKLDGANASIWWDNGVGVCCGSRNMILSEGSNLQGFREWVNKKTNDLEMLFLIYPEWRIYGEWMVPHTLKTYRDDVWKKFWAFDVCLKDELINYDTYAPVLKSYELNVIEPIANVKKGELDIFLRVLEQNTYLIEDGKGVGEGIVIKRYDYRNKYGKQTWAKLVRNDFKEANKRAFGITDIDGFVLEAEIAEKFVTKALVDKTRAKIEQETTERRSLIPRLLQTVFHDLVKEEMWEIIKEFKQPSIDFRKLQRYTIVEIKKHAENLF